MTNSSDKKYIEFEKRLESLINELSMENDSDTPDFILAKFLTECFRNFNRMMQVREEWYGKQ